MPTRAEALALFEKRRDGSGEIAWRGMSVCDVRNGRIVRWREYWNPADVEAA